MLSYDVKFLTCDDSILVRNADLNSFKYETKRRSEESVFDTGKRSYCERRNGKWRVPKHRQLKQLEIILRDKTIIHSEWLNECLVAVVFSSGAIAYITINQSLDILQVLFDRYCIGKLAGQIVCDVIISRTHLLFIHGDKIATLVTFGKSANYQPCRIKDRDPHIQNIELGGASRRTERHVSAFEISKGIRVLVWGSTSLEPAPWSPVIEDLANLHFYEIIGQQVTLLAYHQLENETLLAEISRKSNNIINIVEQGTCQKNGVSLDWLVYEVPQSDRVTKLSTLRESTTTASLPAPARVVRKTQCDSRLLAACIDGTVHVIHKEAGLTHSTRAGFIATDVRWSGELIMVLEEGCRLQCFDRALTLLHQHTKCLDFNCYLRESRRMQVLTTRACNNGNILLTLFSGGPLTLLRISHPKLFTSWLRSGRTSNAISLLRALDWDSEGAECLNMVSTLVKSTLNGGEAESVAEAAIGVYFAPTVPHSLLARKYTLPLQRIARKFFHHLLRRGRVEKALSLAVDLCDWDLFVDAHWLAKKLQLNQLAEEAAMLANHHAQLEMQDSECSDSCSQCSSHSYTSSEDTSASSEHERTKPPPLPRVPNSHPTLMQVPINYQEPTSTNSIRPNLHQYLERDNTIWNTNVKEDEYICNSKPSNLKLKWKDNVLSNYQKQNSGVRNEGRMQMHYSHVFPPDKNVENHSMYRYQTNCCNDSMLKLDDRPNKQGERNKVKFSDTVTIAVVPNDPPPSIPQPERELADSLPLCPPHAYLAAFTPADRDGTAHDYVEV